METNIKIETLAARYLKLKADIDNANTELEKLKKEIKDELGDELKYESKNYKISVSDVTRKTLQPALVEEMFKITLPDNCYKITNSPRFTVKDMKPITDDYQPVDASSLDDLKI